MQNIQEFIDLGLSEKSLAAIQAKGFETPTEIQKRCIPVLLSGHGDLIGQAQTGTGKTAAFALPILEMLDGMGKTEKNGLPKALVLVPTRELCIQVCEEIHSLAQGRPVRTTSIYGGASYNIQFRDLKSGVDIVVGTPGRIQDHIERETLKLDQIKVCVLDEADEMLDMGFIEDIENILSKMPEDRQTLCFSATMPDPILKLASRFMKDYELIRVQTEDMTSTLTKQI
ncbi:MAG: DEAD/DEAH box helicase, partial [Spirochaetales bacterium]|nr:DEAD/DEAH box helicase [Spirochaetales bacterium]